MENEEMKGCCENKEGGMACCHSMSNCCHNWRKCHIMKKIVMLVIIIIAFCLGSQWGEMKSESRGGQRFERGGMMNWGYGKLENKNINLDEGTGSVTVEVTKPATPAAPVAPKQ